MGWLTLGLIAGTCVIDVPIGFALGITAVVLLVMSGGVNLSVVTLSLFSGADNFPLLAIPLFIAAGNLMNRAGITHRLVDFASSLVGFIRGGLAHVSIVTSMFFAEISGSAVADAAALGTVLIPAMERKGYPKNFASAVISSAATIAIIIPPSIPMIIYGVTAGVSIGKLFIAGIIPGILTGFVLMGVAYVFARRDGYPTEARFALRRVGETFRAAIWAFSIPIIIIGGILGGVFTATESAAAADGAALFVGFAIHRTLKPRDLPEILLAAAKQTAIVMLIVATSALLGWFLSNEQIPQKVAQAILRISRDKNMVLLMLNLIFLLVGMILHSAAAIIMIVPIVMPLVHALGIDPVHFGLVLTINLGIGQQTPPVASVLLTVCALANVTIGDVMRYLIYFVGGMLVVLFLVTYIPALSLWLPNTFMP